MPSGYPHTHPAILHCLLPWLVHVLCHFLGISFSFALLRPRPLPIIPACHHALHQGLLGCHMGLGSSTCDPRNGVKKSRRKNNTINMHRFFCPNAIFRRVRVQNENMSEREIHGSGNASGPPRAGAGLKKANLREARRNFFCRIGRGYHSKQLQLDSFNVRIYRLTPGVENKQKSRSHRNFTKDGR